MEDPGGARSAAGDLHSTMLLSVLLQAAAASFRNDAYCSKKDH